MPRFSNKNYWKYHKTLRKLWLDHISVYGYLSMARQRQLHDFYQPSKDWSKEELLTYRKQITAKRPDLPKQAAWALKEMQRVVEAPARVRVPLKASERVTVARPIIKPEPDIDKIARAYLKMAFRKMGLDLEEYEKELRDNGWKNSQS